MTCSRLFILGALLTIAPPVTAQPAAPAPAPAAPTAAAPKATAQPTPAKPAKPAAKPAVAAAPAPAVAAPTTPAAPVAAPAADPAAKPATKPAAKPATKPAAAAATPTAPVAAKPAAVAAPPVKYPFGLPEPKLRAVRHKVEVIAAERHPAKRDELIQPGSKVSTPPQGSADINFSDGTRLFVSENSEVSLYGVAPPPPPPGKKKGKPPVFKPGTTTLHRGEVVLMVPAPPPPPVAPAAVAPPPAGKGQKPAKVAKVAKGKKVLPPPPVVTASIATPVGKIVASPGSELRISVDQAGLTRVSVYRGEVRLLGKGKPVLLAGGAGGSIQDVKTPPKPGSPLPPQPVLANIQQLVASAGEPVTLSGSYSLAAGAPPANGWHVQVARDAEFDSLIHDSRRAVAETTLPAQAMKPGDYYVRVSAVGADGLEGQPSAPTRVRVAKMTLVAGAQGKRAAVNVEGKDLYCSLDGAPLSPVNEPLSLSPARPHLVRCATVANDPRPEQLVEQRYTAAQSGPLVARMEPGAVSFTAADPKAQIEATGQRQVTLVLGDAVGNPVGGAAVVAEGVGGARVGEVRESATAGSYVASVSWAAGQTGQSIRYRINDTETFESRLPDAAPPVVEKPVDEVSDQPNGKRVAFELALFPTAGIDTSRLIFNIGAGFEVGTRIRLPYGAIAIALRPQYEYFPAAPAVAHVIAGGLPITYRIRKNVDADIVPYIGVLPQFLAHYDFLAKDGVQVSDGSWQRAFALGGLLGTEFRVKRGAVFVEGGYRQVLYRSADTLDSFPTLNGLFANLGFRLTF